MHQLHRADTALEVPVLHFCIRRRCTAIASVWAFLTPFIVEIMLLLEAAVILLETYGKFFSVLVTLFIVF